MKKNELLASKYFSILLIAIEKYKIIIAIADHISCTAVRLKWL